MPFQTAIVESEQSSPGLNSSRISIFYDDNRYAKYASEVWVAYV